MNGDLLDALTRAREIDERILHFRKSGQIRHRRLDHATIVTAFLADVRSRADAGEIDPATERRYEAALRHYLAFCRLPTIAKSFQHAAGINRDFRLRFETFLNQREVPANGRSGAEARPMRGQGFVLDTVRALYEWAADAERGNLLPEGFRNPFLRSLSSRPSLNSDLLAAPDITASMAIELVNGCDAYQLKLLMPILLFGLRAAEPCYLFLEYFAANWLRVPCNVDLGYQTKGRRDKRFPLVGDLEVLWSTIRGERSTGLIYLNRRIDEGKQERGSITGASLADLIEEYRRRCAASRSRSAAENQRIRDKLLREAGGITYDDIEQEFKVVTRRLGWPAQATLRDLRHLFATTMNNACMPESYRRYLMGHAPPKAAVTDYTHLDQVERHYRDAVHREWKPLIDAIRTKCQSLRALAPHSETKSPKLRQ